MSIQKLLNSPKKKLALTHAGADVDSLASAAALHYSYKNVHIGIPDHLNLSSKKLAETLNIPYKINPTLTEFDALICVDFNSVHHTGTMAKQVIEFKGEIGLIDHHTQTTEKIANPKMRFSNPNAISTTELIYLLLKKSKKKPCKKTAQLIACGIITDSAGFLVADYNSFKIMGEVMSISKSSFRNIVDLFNVETDPSERIAKLKAAKRSRIFKIGECIAVTTNVGAFEASSAGTLIKLGADIAFAGDCEKGKILLSGRASNEFVSKNKFDLANHIFAKLPQHFNGTGGGHAGAAGFNGRAKNIEPILKKCIELTHEFIKKKNPHTTIKEHT
jgi:bifunctional oligoribonuclease and PAP phosphatase NrnA